MKLMKSTVAMAVLAFTAYSASAADLGFIGSTKDPAPSGYSLQTWTGFWVGLGGGAQFGNDVLDYNYSHDNKHWDEYDYTASAFIDGMGRQGLVGELSLGYDRQFGAMVLGIMGGLNIDTTEFEGGVAGPNDSLKVSYENEWAGVLGPRLGYSFNGNHSMLYAAGGWAFGEIGNVKVNGVDLFQTENGFAKNQDTNLSGWFAEVGGEHRFDDRWSLKLSGRYTQYGKIDLAKETVETDCYEDEHHLTLKPRDLKAMATIVFRP